MNGPAGGTRHISRPAVIPAPTLILTGAGVGGIVTPFFVTFFVAGFGGISYFLRGIAALSRMQREAPVEGRIGVFLIEFGLVFVLTAVGFAFLAWRIKQYSGTDIFSSRNYLLAGVAVTIAVAVIRLMAFNERKTGRAFF